MARKWYYISSVIIFVMLSLSSCGSRWIRPPVAEGGTLDLRRYVVSRRDAIPLVGEWDFFPGVFLREEEIVNASKAETRRVPDLWNRKIAEFPKGTGYGTYRLVVLLPEDCPYPLSIQYTTVSTAFELEANGVTIARAGNPSDNPREALSAYKPGVSAIAGTAEGRIVLAVRVSNYNYRTGGLWRPFYLGPSEYLSRREWREDAQSFALLCSLATCATAVLVVFLVGGFRRELICLSAFAFVSALRSVVTGSYVLVKAFPTLGFSALIRLEYLTVFTAYPLGFLFFWILFPSETPRASHRVFPFLFTAFLMLVPFAPLRVLTFSLLPYYAVIVAIFIGSAIILLRAAACKRPGAIPLLVGASVLGAASFNDILYSNFLVQTANLFPYGMLVFIGTQIFAITLRYLYMQRCFGRSLAEKELLIKEVHHRVKNSLQIVSSITSLQASRTSDPVALDAYRSVQSRLRAVSIVHEKLYNLSGDETIDLCAYARDLTGQLAESYGNSGGLRLEARSLSLPGDFCMDIGLILTELVSNAYKYAADADGAVSIVVRIESEEDLLTLSVEDEGPGFPAEFDPRTSSTLGYRLVSVLAKKRDAMLKIEKGRGAVVSLTFPLSQESSKGPSGPSKSM